MAGERSFHMQVSLHAIRRYRQRFNSSGNALDILDHIKKSRLATDLERQIIYLTRPHPSRKKDSPNVYLDGNIAFVVVEDKVLTCYDCAYLYYLDDNKDKSVALVKNKAKTRITLQQARRLHKQYTSGKTVYYLQNGDMHEVSLGVSKGRFYMWHPADENRKLLCDLFYDDFCILELETIS